MGQLYEAFGGRCNCSREAGEFVIAAGLVRSELAGQKPLKPRGKLGWGVPDAELWLAGRGWYSPRSDVRLLN